MGEVLDGDRGENHFSFLFGLNRDVPPWVRIWCFCCEKGIHFEKEKKYNYMVIER